MAETAEKPATYADIEALPEHLVGEILFGHLVMHPRPARRHGGATSALGVAVGGPFQFGSGGSGGWIFVDEPELHLGTHIVVPDIAGWRRERMTEPAERAWFEVAPDWVCESLSPSTERYDKGDKRRIYATYGVEHLWFIEPRAQPRGVPPPAARLAADPYGLRRGARARAAVRRDRVLARPALAVRPAFRYDT